LRQLGQTLGPSKIGYTDTKIIKYRQPEYLELLWIPNSGEAEIKTDFPFAFTEHKRLDRLSTYSLHVAFSVDNIITEIIVDAEYKRGAWMLSVKRPARLPLLE